MHAKAVDPYAGITASECERGDLAILGSHFAHLQLEGCQGPWGSRKLALRSLICIREWPIVPEANMLFGSPPNLSSSVAGSKVLEGSFNVLAGVWPQHQRPSCKLDFVVFSSCIKGLSNGYHFTVPLSYWWGNYRSWAETFMWLRFDLEAKGRF